MKIRMTRRRFFNLYLVLQEMMRTSKGIIKYYINKNLEMMKVEYESLQLLESELVPTGKVSEFLHKKSEYLGAGGKSTDASYTQLIKMYEDSIYEYDTLSNNMNSFLHQKDEYEYFPIPHSHFPDKMDRLQYEFMYLLIEEDKNTLNKKYGEL